MFPLLYIPFSPVFCLHFFQSRWRMHLKIAVLRRRPVLVLFSTWLINSRGGGFADGPHLFIVVFELKLLCSYLVPACLPACPLGVAASSLSPPSVTPSSDASCVAPANRSRECSFDDLCNLATLPLTQLSQHPPVPLPQPPDSSSLFPPKT